MRVFKDVGLVEQLGSGMSRILKAYDRNIFNISEHFIKVEFPFSVPKDMPIADIDDVSNVSDDVSNASETDTERRVLDFLRQEPAATGRGMAEILGISDRQVWRILKKLRENGTLVRIGTTRNGYWKINEK